ncbi:MAG: hypothetical protein OSP8Acid_01660 [uncultured Acidilobus sp. OSP8]|nr:MAG: hypothetical protein OSP8Acid_01660 [uncultured Acidilobus sp. OSP8]
MLTEGVAVPASEGLKRQVTRVS